MHELMCLSIVLCATVTAATAQERLVVTDRAAMILNLVKPDSTAEFEIGLAQLRVALAATSDPVKKQQAQGWRMYRAAEPIGPNALYIFILDPAVPFADYSFKRLLDSLPPDEAEAALKRLSGSLAEVQRVFSMTLHAEPERPPDKAKERPELKTRQLAVFEANGLEHVEQPAPYLCSRSLDSRIVPCRFVLAIDLAVTLAVDLLP